MRCLKKNTWKEIGIISGTIVAIMLFVYEINGLYPFGNGLVSRADMTQQTIPAMIYYWDVLHFKASPFFCWNSGMGLNISGAFNLGAFFSPLNLFLYFTTRSNIYRFTNILVILKMVCIAISMYAYLTKYSKTHYGRIIGSLLYAFSGASLVHYQIMLVMEAAFFLPLLLIGVDRIIHKKKPLFFILIFAYAIITDLYTAAISLLFIFIYYGTQYYFERPSKERKKNTLLLGLSVAEGFLLSGYILVPAWISIAKSPRGSSNIGIISTYKWLLECEWLPSEINIIRRLLVNIALPLAFIIYFFIANNKTIKEQFKRYKSQLILILIMIISMVIPGIEMMWYGGSRASWPIRFIYASVFALVNFSVLLINNNYPDKESSSKPPSNTIIIAVTIITCVIITLLIQTVYLSDRIFKMGSYADMIIGLSLEFILIIVYMILLLAKKKNAICVLLISEITITSMMAFYPNKDLIDGWNPSVFKNADAVAVAINDLDTSEFHRVKNIDYDVMSAHHPLLMNTEGVSNFWHVIDTRSIKENARLGYEISYSRELDHGGTYFSDALLHNYTYFGSEELPSDIYNKIDTVDILDGINVYEAKYPLPLVVSTNNPDVPNTAFFEYQNYLYSEFTDSSAPLLVDVSSQVKDSSITLKITGTQTIYFYGDNNVVDKINIMINGAAYKIKMYEFPDNYDYIPFAEAIPDYTYGMPSMASEFSGIIPLGTYTNETITIKFDGNISDNQIHLATLSVDDYVAAMSDSNSHSTKVTDLKRGHSSLNMTVEGITEDYILLPIAYQEGWNVTINGEKVTPDSYCGMCLLKVSGDTADIKMNFVAPGTYTGIAMSILGVIILTGIMLINGKKPLITTRMVSVLSIVADIAFMCIFYPLLLVMFVIPLFGHFLV
ncbi:MAG: YfhO family protein [Saccharofermentans sp.]|nr:YfhO family protein [Saccharofermentans sp.]